MCTFQSWLSPLTLNGYCSRCLLSRILCVSNRKKINSRGANKVSHHIAYCIALIGYCHGNCYSNCQTETKNVYSTIYCQTISTSKLKLCIAYTTVTTHTVGK